MEWLVPAETAEEAEKFLREDEPDLFVPITPEHFIKINSIEPDK